MSRNKLPFRKVKNRIEAINSFFPFPVFCFVDFAMCIIELGAKDSGLLKLHGQTKNIIKEKILFHLDSNCTFSYPFHALYTFKESFIDSCIQ